MAAGASQAAPLGLSDALRLALSANAGLQIQEQQVEFAAARQQQAAAAFDPVLRASADYVRTVDPVLAYGQPFRQTDSASRGYQLGWSQALRNGAVLDAALVESTLRPDGAPDGVPERRTSTLLLSLNLPLLKGRGAVSASADDDLARLQQRIAGHALRQQAARLVYDTLLAYWSYRAGGALQAVAASSEERSRNLLESNRRLVAQDAKPRADLVLLEADYQDKVAARHAAELAAGEARRALGRLLGVDAAAVAALPEAGDPFPDTVDVERLGAARAALDSDALERRPDMRLARTEVEAAQRQLDAASANLRPQLDLQLSLGYGRAALGGSPYWLPPQGGRSQSAPSVAAHLNYRFPLSNGAAKGEYRAGAAQLAQASLRLRELRDEIGVGIDGALQALARTAAQLAASKQALAQYQSAVEQEITKQQHGIATLIDVVNVEARYGNARVALLQQQQAYAQALARLRFVTGTVLEERPGAAPRDAVDVANLTRLGPLARYAPALQP